MLKNLSKSFISIAAQSRKFFATGGKVVSMEQAISKVKDGDFVLVGGFGKIILIYTERI